MRRRSIPAAVVLALVAAVYTWAFVDSPMEPIQGDGYYTWLWARSLAYDGDLELSNDYETCGDPWRLARGEGSDLGPRNSWTPGPAVVWTPMLLFARAVHPDARGDGRVAQGCGGSVAHFGVFGSVIMALLALWLAYRLSRRYVGDGPALVATAGVALASALPYYACYLASYGHAGSAFAVALFFERWDATRGRDGWGRWALLGALLALAMLMRPQNGVIAVAPLIEWIGAVRRSVQERDRRRSLRLVALGAVFVACAFVVFCPQMWAWKHAYGTWLAMPQGPHYMRWGEASIDGVLFASTGGLLVWTPLLVFSVLGLLAAPLARTTRTLGVALVLAFAATTYVNASGWDYWGSMGFSNRRFTSMTLSFVFGLSLVAGGLFRWAERRPRHFAAASLATVVVAFGAWNWAAMYGVASFDIKSWREAPWEQYWNQTFQQLSHNVYDKVGNPVAWPASVPFAVAHDVHPKHYDAMRGMSVLYAEYQDRQPRKGEETADFTKRLRRLYLVEGFEEQPRKVLRRKAAVTRAERARMLIPFFIDDVGGVEMHWTAVPVEAEDDGKSDEGKGKRKGKTKGKRKRREPSTVVLEWEGRQVAQVRVPAKWTKTRIDLPDDLVEAGVNELVWHVDGPPIAIRSLEALPE